MVEVECPSCTKTVDMKYYSTGTYECPYCHEDFEYESSIKNNLKNNQSQFGYMMYGVKKVTKPFAGYYRLGVLRDYNEEEKEELLGVYSNGQVVLKINRKERKNSYSKDLWLFIEYRDVKYGKQFLEKNRPVTATLDDF